MKIRVFSMLLLVLVLSLSAISARADILGAAASYAVIGGSTVGVTNGATNTSDTVVIGDMAVSPGTSCSGFVAGTGCTLGFGTVSGATNLGNVAAAAAEAGVDTAELALAASGPGTDWTATPTLGSGGLHDNIAPGVYSFGPLVTALLNGTLTLAGGGDAAPVWIFLMGRDLTTASGSSVLVTGTGAASAGIYWVTGTQATLGDSSTFQGNILAGSAAVFDPGAQITCGRAFADTQVTFAGNNPGTPSGTPNVVNSGPCGAGTSGSSNGNDNGVITPGGGVGPGPVVGAPEPGTLALLPFGLFGLAVLKFRKPRVTALGC